MKIDKESFYRKCPVALQNALCSLEGWRIQRMRYSRPYEAIAADVRGRVRLSAERLETFQSERLKAHFAAASRTPFWSRRFAACGVDIGADDPWLELAKLPILTKGEVQSASDAIQNPSYGAHETVTAHTSGTTGAGLVLPVTVSGVHEQWATWWRYREWHGIDRATWSGYFGGRSVVPTEKRTRPYWRVNYPGRQVMFSAYHLKSETARYYADALRHYAVPWLHGYPSVLSLLAGYIIDQGLETGGAVRVVTIGAESLQAHQKSFIGRAFGCPVRQHYGLTEGVANISEDAQGDLRVDEDFAPVEFVDDASTGAHRIIGTNWTNPAFPLFRYDTGDLAVLDTEHSGDSGWRLVASIDGRKEDYVTLPDGTKLGRLDHIFKDLVEIAEAQIFQEDLRRITIRVVKTDRYTQATERRLIAEARKRLGDSLQINCEYLPKLERGSSGKLKFVVSRVG